jgi:hypothetical protein
LVLKKYGFEKQTIWKIRLQGGKWKTLDTEVWVNCESGE